MPDALAAIVNPKGRIDLSGHPFLVLVDGRACGCFSQLRTALDTALYGAGRYREGVDWQIIDRKSGVQWDRETLDVRMAG